MLGLKGGMVPIRTTEALSKQTMDALLPGMDFMHFNIVVKKVAEL